MSQKIYVVNIKNSLIKDVVVKWNAESTSHNSDKKKWNSNG